MQYLGIEESKLKETNSFNTAFEIESQFLKWEELLKEYNEVKIRIDEFLSKIGFGEEFDVVFTGAGTSEYVGNILEPLLNEKSDINFKSISTTDIVINPELYLKKDKKTLLVSFARSGDSPESVEAVNLANKIVKEVYHLFITCNKDGELAKISKENNKTFLYLMPEGTNDKGFAMTSSFSSMLLSAILIFKNPNKESVKKAIDTAKKALYEKMESMKELANKDHERIIVLGSGIYKGLAQELTLKVMELSRGIVVSKSDTVLGFRHGPKAIVDDKTIVFMCTSANEFARKYEYDLLKEIYDENISKDIVSYSLDDSFKNVSTCIYPNEVLCKCNLTALLTYLVLGQTYAFFKSQYFNLTTDNPFPSKVVNRVVKKFEIYDYEVKE